MAELLQWDVEGQKHFYGGVSKGVLFIKNASVYGNGIAWDGLTGVEESPEGGDANEIYADNITYAKIRGREKFNFTIEALDYPEEFEECDGSARPAAGLIVGQQTRKQFGFSYRNEIGSDDLGDFTKGYLINLVYGCSASPVSKSHETINDSPDAETFSWSCESTAVPISATYGTYKPTAHLVIDSRTTPSAVLTAIEEAIYGVAAEGSSEAVQAYLPLPDDVFRMFGVEAVSG